MGNLYYAHTSKTRPWEPLIEHLIRVAKLAGDFATAFDSQEWGMLAGIWHDLGKYSDAFQAYLKKNNQPDVHTSEMSGRVDHSTAGAQWAKEHFGKTGLILAHVIAAHHSGLLDYSSEISSASLASRLSKPLEPWREHAPKELICRDMPPIPRLGSPKDWKSGTFKVSFWLRMLFSCLVDADFLATEEYANPEKSSLRIGGVSALPQMKETLEDFLMDLQSKANETSVNKARAYILSQCRLNAGLSPGFFDLCVPTGGGKTLASLTFAINHAIQHNQQRVITAIPFTSIIEQNADVYRGIFHQLGDHIILEHHSNVDPEQENQTNRIQSENWDAPLIVTTNVQLFESLFAKRTSRCRKLHRIARSVIVLDEVQTLPVELLEPTLLALKELVEVYGCSVVLCSATKPALEKRDDFPIGITNLRKLVNLDDRMVITLKRTRITVIDGALTDENLVNRLQDQNRVLCVVNTRRHASTLAELLGENPDHFHLSTRMCPAHRNFVLEMIRNKLMNGDCCRVVSTQLIEAGVDVDFPVVYRAQCGLDSLIQAAGRCNREGKLNVGNVFYFESPDLLPPGMLRQTADAGKQILSQYTDPMDDEAVEAYFCLHFWRQKELWDKHNVLHESTLTKNPSSMRFQFATIAERYRFIRENGAALLVPWCDDGKHFRDRMMNRYPPDRDEWRRMQRYCIQVNQHELKKLQDAGAVDIFHERWILLNESFYSESLGLINQSNLSYEDFVV